MVLCNTMRMKLSGNTQRKSGSGQPTGHSSLADARGAKLDEIADLFLSRGFAGTSVDAINAITGGSKRDLYRVFGDKETLFKRVVVELCKERVEALKSTIFLGQTAEASLTAAGVAFLEMLLSPRTLALHRLLVAEGSRLPEVAADFLREGPSGAYSAFADVLRHHAAQGEIDAPDPATTARLFLDSISGSFQLRALVGEEIEEAEIRETVTAAADLFLKALLR
jgi:AcrR family transcriptional regulator